MKNNESIRVILIQAPADVLYALQLIELYKSSKLIIYVLNVHNVYKMLQLLNISDCEIYFIPYPTFYLKSIKVCFKTRKSLLEIWDKYFKKICKNVGVLHFFSRYEDPMAAFIIARFLKNNRSLQVIYNDHYDPKHMPPKTLVGRIKGLVGKILIHLITGAKYELVDVKFPEFKANKYKRIIYKPLIYSPEYAKKYKYTINDTKAVLFLLNPLFANSDNDDVCLSVITDIVNEFKKRGYVTYVKGHPRMGISKEYLDIMDKELECYLLSEFIDYDAFEYVIGVDSTAVAHVALEKKLNVYSILDIVHCYNYEVVRNHLIEQSQGFLKFIKNANEIIKA